MAKPVSRKLLPLLLLLGIAAPGGVLGPSRGQTAPAKASPRTGCPRCRAPIKAGWLFCDQCGLRLSARGPAPVRKGPKLVPSDPAYVVLQPHTRPTGQDTRLLVDAAGVAAAISIDGKPKGVAGKEIRRLAPGQRKITLSAPGYVTQEITLRMSRGLTYLKTALERANGALLVAETGVSDLVSVDGRPHGASPVEVLNLAPGEHTLTIQAPRFKTVTRKVIVKPGEMERIQIALERETGALYVAATGVPDEVIVNGKSYGRSPVEVPDLQPGVHSLKVQAEGYAPHVRQLNVVAGPRQEVRLSLERLTGTLYVVATGVPDEVVVDGKSYGRSPVEIPKVATGRHTLTITAEGYEPVTREVTVTAGPRQEVRVALEPVSGSLFIADAGIPADVFVDDVAAGVTPRLITSLRPGVHRVRIEARGYRPHQEDVEIAAGKMRELRVRLTQLPPPLVVRATGLKDRVLVDEKEYGPTPLTLRDLAPGAHVIRIEAEGYQPYEERVRIEPERTLTLEPKLAPLKRTGIVAFHFIVSPEAGGGRLDAKVWVNRKGGQAPALDKQDVAGGTLGLELPPGEYELEIEPFVSKAEARTTPVRQKISVALGQTLSCRVTVGLVKSDGRMVTTVRNVQLVIQ